MPESEVLLRNKDRESVTKLLNQKNHELEDVTFTVKEIENNNKKSLRYDVFFARFFEKFFATLLSL